jgi:hypothetical protein
MAQHGDLVTLLDFYGPGDVDYHKGWALWCGPSLHCWTGRPKTARKSGQFQRHQTGVQPPIEIVRLVRLHLTRQDRRP